MEVHFPFTPFFLIGILAGWLVFDYFKSRDELLKTTIGAVLLGMTALHFCVNGQKQRQGRQIAS